MFFFSILCIEPTTPVPLAERFMTLPRWQYPLISVNPYPQLLLDVEESCRARWEEIMRGRVVGRGAFGTVHAAAWRGQAGALKALQPVAPEPRAPTHAHNAYKVTMIYVVNF